MVDVRLSERHRHRRGGEKREAQQAADDPGSLELRLPVLVERR